MVMVLVVIVLHRVLMNNCEMYVLKRMRKKLTVFHLLEL